MVVLLDHDAIISKCLHVSTPLMACKTSFTEVLQHVLSISGVAHYPIVTIPPGGHCNSLLNPANEFLCGTQFPYHPIGGPMPEPRNGGWGGSMIRNSGNVLYDVECIDGQVSLLGGKELHGNCMRMPPIDKIGRKCSVGGAVPTEATGQLKTNFSWIIHTVALFWSRNISDGSTVLLSCYLSTFKTMWGDGVVSDFFAPFTVSSLGYPWK